MLFEGNPEVLRNLYRKQQLLQQGGDDHRTIRPALLICGGTMRGVYGGGGTIALERAGMTDVFDVAVGVSTGAPVLGYFLGGHVEENLNIYWRECVGKEFISFTRFVRGGPLVETRWLAEVFRGNISRPPLNQEGIKQSRTDFYTAVTCATSGDGILLDAKKTRDVVEAIHASISLPGVSSGDVCVDGRWYTDGAGALPFPVKRIVEEFSPTDLLVFANCPRPKRGGEALEAALLPFFLRTVEPSVQKVFARMHDTMCDSVEVSEACTTCRVAVVWADRKVGLLNRNARDLSAAAERAQTHFAELLNMARTEVLGQPALTT